jgi:hypothetical protein
MAPSCAGVAQEALGGWGQAPWCPLTARCPPGRVGSALAGLGPRWLPPPPGGLRARQGARKGPQEAFQGWRGAPRPPHPSWAKVRVPGSGSAQVARRLLRGNRSRAEGDGRVGTHRAGAAAGDYSGGRKATRRYRPSPASAWPTIQWRHRAGRPGARGRRWPGRVGEAFSSTYFHL